MILESAFHHPSQLHTRLDVIAVFVVIFVIPVNDKIQNANGIDRASG